MLKDEDTLNELNVGPNDFFVCMVGREPPKVCFEIIQCFLCLVLIYSSQPKSAATPVNTSQTVPPAPSSAPQVSITPPPAPMAASASVSTASAPTPAPPAESSFINPLVLEELIGMGFEENQCRRCLIAAHGNADLAFEFLSSGNVPSSSILPPSTPITSSQPSVNPSSAASPEMTPLERFRFHPQFASLQRLIQENPASVSQVLDLIGQQDPQLLEVIHADHEGFMRMMNEPIREPAEMPATPAFNASGDMGMGMGMPAQMSPNDISRLLYSMTPEQRVEFAQSIGVQPDQLDQVVRLLASMSPEQLASLGGPAGAGGLGGSGGRGQGIRVQLTSQEMEAVQRLMALGFSQDDAIQAYLACDRNEELAANFLFDSADYDDGMDNFGDYEGDNM